MFTSTICQYKFIHNVIATNENLLTWKISYNSLWIFCNDPETLYHFLPNCSYLSVVWEKVLFACRKSRISIQLRVLKHLAVGNKIIFVSTNKKNELLTYIGFSIILCKSYFRRKQRLNLITMLKNETNLLIQYDIETCIHYKLVKKFIDQLM